MLKKVICAFYYLHFQSLYTSQNVVSLRVVFSLKHYKDDEDTKEINFRAVERIKAMNEEATFFNYCSDMFK